MSPEESVILAGFAIAIILILIYVNKVVGMWQF
jgi:hypothetical protein